MIDNNIIPYQTPLMSQIKFSPEGKDFSLKHQSTQNIFKASIFDQKLTTDEQYKNKNSKKYLEIKNKSLMRESSMSFLTKKNDNEVILAQIKQMLCIIIKSPTRLFSKEINQIYQQLILK